MIIRFSLLGLIIAVAVGFFVMRSDNGISQKEADQLQQQSQQLQRKAQQTADDVRSGKVDPEDAAKDLQKDANQLADDTIDAAKDANLPDDVKKQLEEAQAQLDAAGSN